MGETDSLRRFLFEHAPLRGHWVRLEAAWLEARTHQNLPAPVMRLLGEALAAAALLAASLKFTGTLTLQSTGGGGAVSLLIVQATHDLKLRGVARLAEGANVEAADFQSLLGGGQITVTIDVGNESAPYQGIVPVVGDSLATCLENYFATSEQLPTQVVLAADPRRAAGMLLQKLPTPQGVGESAEAQLAELWGEASALFSTLRPAELLEEEPAALLPRVFAGHDLRLHDAERVRFECRCSPERVGSLLRSLGQDEVRSIVADEGAVTVTCEFCQRPYRYDAVDAEALFAPGSATPDGSARLN